MGIANRIGSAPIEASLRTTKVRSVPPVALPKEHPIVAAASEAREKDHKQPSKPPPVPVDVYVSSDEGRSALERKDAESRADQGKHRAKGHDKRQAEPHQAPEAKKEADPKVDEGKQKVHELKESGSGQAQAQATTAKLAEPAPEIVKCVEQVASPKDDDAKAVEVARDPKPHISCDDEHRRAGGRGHSPRANESRTSGRPPALEERRHARLRSQIERRAIAHHREEEVHVDDAPAEAPMRGRSRAAAIGKQNNCLATFSLAPTKPSEVVKPNEVTPASPTVIKAAVAGDVQASVACEAIAAKSNIVNKVNHVSRRERASLAPPRRLHEPVRGACVASKVQVGATKVEAKELVVSSEIVNKIDSVVCECRRSVRPAALSTRALGRGGKHVYRSDEPSVSPHEKAHRVEVESPKQPKVEAGEYGFLEWVRKLYEHEHAPDKKDDADKRERAPKKVDHQKVGHAQQWREERETRRAMRAAHREYQK